MTKPTRRARPLAVIALGIGILAPATARGQTVDPQRALAETLYKQATAEMDAKSYASACRKLEDVTRIVPEGLGAKLTLAKCYEGFDKLASAWLQYRLVEQMATKTGQAERLKEASAGAAALRPKLSTLVIEVPSDVRSINGLVIALDGAPLGEPLWGTPLPVDAGEHEIVATAPGREPWKGTIEIGANWVKASFTVKPPEVTPILAPKSALPANAGPPALKRPWQRPVGIAAMGVGGAGVALGALLGGLAFAKNSESNQDNHCDASNRCDKTGLDLRRQVLSLGNGSTAAIGAGVVILAGGVALFATAPSSGATQERAGAKTGGIWVGVELTPGFLRVEGAW